jgi:hypothetical protein
MIAKEPCRIDRVSRPPGSHRDTAGPALTETRLLLREVRSARAASSVIGYISDAPCRSGTLGVRAMTAGQRVIARPSFQGQTAALVLASTFAIGVVTGLVVPLVHLVPAQQAAAATGDPAVAAWLSFREGERTLPVMVSQVGDPIWRMFRQDERSSVLSTDVAVSPNDAWRTYRESERGDGTP